MSELWPWLALAGLGAYHGINPAMGWLFAVALGLNRKSRAVVLGSLLPIAIGHALAIAVVVALVAGLGMVIDLAAIRLGAGIVLLAWGVYHLLYGSRHHRVRVGMRAGFAGLAFWSFMMASAHGAGLMLVPVLIPLGLGAPAGHGHAPAQGPAALALGAVAVHSLAMLVVTGAVAVLVYEWVGVAVLRRGWVNLDLLWSLALVATGLVLILL